MNLSTNPDTSVWITFGITHWALFLTVALYTNLPLGCRNIYGSICLTARYAFVLVLAGIELIFCIVASMGLCFGFVLKTVLIIQGCFRYCWAALTQSQGLFCSPPHQRAGWGCTRSWEGTQPGQLTPTAQRDIPYHRTPCSAYKAGGRRRKGGTLGVMAFCLPK